jgi:hypothetical protein
MQQLSENDLERLIDEKLQDCEGYENICDLMATQEGKRRIKVRVKQIIYDDGITSIEAALAQVETELRFS